MDTKTGNRCKNALNFSSPSDCVAARHKLKINFVRIKILLKTNTQTAHDKQKNRSETPKVNYTCTLCSSCRNMAGSKRFRTVFYDRELHTAVGRIVPCLRHVEAPANCPTNPFWFLGLYSDRHRNRAIVATLIYRTRNDKRNVRLTTGGDNKNTNKMKMFKFLANYTWLATCNDRTSFSFFHLNVSMKNSIILKSRISFYISITFSLLNYYIQNHNRDIPNSLQNQIRFIFFFFSMD